jgi:hypothetical protein
MANPGYPQMGNPMGNPMMGGPPQQMQQMRPPPQQMRRGAPKAVPVLVSAGLAIGVFCGLLFGLGTGETEAKASTPEEKKFVGTKIEGGDEGTATTGSVGPAIPKSVTDGTRVTGTIKEPPKTGSAAQGSAVGSAAGSAATVAPTVKVSKVTFTLKPDTVKDAKITVDGVEVANNTIEVALGDKPKKEVVVLVKAPGFKDFEQKLEVDEGEMKVEYPLTKARSSSGGTSTPKRPDPPGGKGGKKPKKPGGGLIDI